VAKIGNEAKLILKLVTEEMQRHTKDNILNDKDLSADYQNGYQQCLSNLDITMRDIVVELEGK